MSATWSDGEYARVAEALRYPLSDQVALSYGVEVYQVVLRLRTQLGLVNDATKVRVLEVADAINQAEAKLYEKGAARPDIERVGDIVFNTQNGIRARSDLIDRQRQKLSDILGIPINPATGQSGGGINGTWTC